MTEKSCFYRPEIEYPCTWEYRIIGRTYSELESAAAEVLDGIMYSIQKSNQTAGGKYISAKIELTVNSDEERTRIYHDFGRHNGIKMVV